MIAVTVFIMFNLLMWFETALEENAAASGSLSDVLMGITRVTRSFGVLFWTVARGDFEKWIFVPAALKAGKVISLPVLG